MRHAIIPLLAAVAYGLLLLVLVSYRRARTRLDRWLLAYYAVSAITSIILSLLEARSGDYWLGQAAIIGWALGLACLLFLTIAYGKWTRWRLALVAVAGWFVLKLLVDTLARNLIQVHPAVLAILHLPLGNAPGVFFALSWLLFSAVLVVRTAVAVARAHLPLYANRLLYWVVVLVLLLLGQFLTLVGEPLIAWAGLALQLAGAGGLLYGISSYHVFDVRNLLRRGAGYLLATLLTALVIIGAIIADRLLVDFLSPDLATTITIGLAVFLAAVFQLVYPRFLQMVRRRVISQGYDTTLIVETYTRTVGNILDLDSLSAAAIQTIDNFFGVHRGGLLLMTADTDHVVIQPAAGLPVQVPQRFPIEGPFISHLRQTRLPLTQYDIDVLPAFQSQPADQRQWLGSMQVDLFVPIVTDGLPIGLLAIGPKRTGEPFRPAELQILQALAAQTVIALANARLFVDMKRLNAEIRALNENLRRSNDRLQYMDQVKTDFITIASHELRTPLTQIRGYTDILDALNEEGLLSREEAARFIANVANATAQLESVISAMLDVSQIDVDAMALTMSEVDMEVILRTAIQPRVKAMRERKLTLTVHNVRRLPRFWADYQRVVQVVANLISNAIKYTPDGGRITISGQVLQDEEGQDREIELIVADTGVGIDPRDQELIFEKFYRAADPQLHSTGSTKFMGAGPGLGLSIVRGLIEAHGGRIWVESDGHDPLRCPGSAFHVILPLRPPHMDQHGLRTPTQQELDFSKLFS